MDRLPEVTAVVTRLLSEPHLDDRLLDRIAAILAHSDEARHAGLRAALDATRSVLADADGLPDRVVARLQRLTADSPPTASDVAALELLAGGPERAPGGYLDGDGRLPPAAAGHPGGPAPGGAGPEDRSAWSVAGPGAEPEGRLRRLWNRLRGRG